MTMDEEMKLEFKKQHIETYKNAVRENILNNTNVLVDEDIMSLLKKPPLDSMDFIKSKFLDLAKKNKIVLNTEELSKILDNYRKYLLKCLADIKKLRVDTLTEIIGKVDFSKDSDVIKVKRGDFNNINKEIKKSINTYLSDGLDKQILKNIKNVFKDDVEEVAKNKIVTDITKYIKGAYHKQLIENLDMKILVKDTTLINTVKETTDRYLFTLSNSRLLNDDNDIA
ncbi:MAG: hypothetical protein IJ463_08795 [Bacilli bacterium]|nr:hypothetical protein [Bacilli bacterium]